MNNEETRDGFEFSERFDCQFLSDLYGGDTHTAEEIFSSSIMQIKEEMVSVEQKAANGDVEAIRRTFHKIKPLFGYMGLLSVQDYVQEFENRFHGPVTMEEIQVPFENIMEIVREAVAQVAQEHHKLRDYNNRRA